jgi:hypothetical protein
VCQHNDLSVTFELRKGIVQAAKTRPTIPFWERIDSQYEIGTLIATVAQKNRPNLVVCAATTPATVSNEKRTMLWIFGSYLLISGLSLVAFIGVILALPPSYFCDDRQLWIDRHPVVRWLGIVGKNLLGLVIIALGIVLSLPGIPGQGLLTIAIGLVLLDFPGKRRFIAAVIGRPAVLSRINDLRRFFQRPPLVVPSRGQR